MEIKWGNRLNTANILTGIKDLVFRAETDL
jgi:hypothetical protein